MYIDVYIDDIILAGKTVKQLKEIKRDLSQEFDIKDLFATSLNEDGSK